MRIQIAVGYSRKDGPHGNIEWKNLNCGKVLLVCLCIYLFSYLFIYYFGESQMGVSFGPYTFDEIYLQRVRQ